METNLLKGMNPTLAGLDLIRRALAGERVVFTKVWFGSGRADEIKPLTHLVSPVKFETVNSIFVTHNDEVALEVVLTTNGLDTGFVLTEIGAFAMGEDGVEVLHSYTCADVGSYVPAQTELYKILLTIKVKVGITKKVCINVDDTILYATNEQVDRLKNAFVLSEDQPTGQIEGNIWRKLMGDWDGRVQFVDYGMIGQEYREMVTGSSSGLVTIDQTIGQIPKGDDLNEALAKLEARLTEAETKIDKLNGLILSLLMQFEIYDGGYFGMVQNEEAVDGGVFEAEPDGEVLDCEGFDQQSSPLWVGGVDGGEY